MLNLEYLQTGKLDVDINTTKTTNKTIQKRDAARPRRTAHAVAYDILTQIYKMNLAEQEFTKSIQGQRHCNVMQHHSHAGKGSDDRHEIHIRSIKGKLYRNDTLATNRHLADTMNMSNDTLQYYLQTLRDLKMLTYDVHTKAHTITAKGIEYTIVWEDVKRLFPYPFNVRKQSSEEAQKVR